MILKNAIDEFLASITIERNLSHNTISSYKRYLNSFNQFLGVNKGVQKITVNNIEDYIKKLKKKNLKETSIIRNISAIKSLFSFMINEDIIKNNITTEINKVKMPEKLPKALSTHEVF